MKMPTINSWFIIIGDSGYRYIGGTIDHETFLSDAITGFAGEQNEDGSGMIVHTKCVSYKLGVCREYAIDKLKREL
jgi:hypothetical protein